MSWQPLSVERLPSPFVMPSEVKDPDFCGPFMEMFFLSKCK